MQNLTEYILSYCNYLEQQGEQIRPLPTLQYIKKPQEGRIEDQKTAYYDPENKKVVLYIHGRKDKDVLRSFSHELVHHQQNLRNTLQPEISTTDTNKSKELNKLEQEAYLRGNILLRNFLDELKDQ